MPPTPWATQARGPLCPCCAWRPEERECKSLTVERTNAHPSSLPPHPTHTQLSQPRQASTMPAFARAPRHTHDMKKGKYNSRGRCLALPGGITSSSSFSFHPTLPFPPWTHTTISFSKRTRPVYREEAGVVSNYCARSLRLHSHSVSYPLPPFLPPSLPLQVPARKPPPSPKPTPPPPARRNASTRHTFF